MALKPELLPGMAVAELQRVGYTEDRSTARAFEHRYPLVVAFGLIFCAVAGYFLLFKRDWLATQEYGGGTTMAALAFLGGLVMAIGAATSHGRHTAHSMRSTQPMFCFQRSDAAEGRQEVIYVDQESRTYFCRVASPGG